MRMAWTNFHPSAHLRRIRSDSLGHTKVRSVKISLTSKPRPICTAVPIYQAKGYLNNYCSERTHHDLFPNLEMFPGFRRLVLGNHTHIQITTIKSYFPTRTYRRRLCMQHLSPPWGPMSRLGTSARGSICAGIRSRPNPGPASIDLYLRALYNIEL